MNDVRDNIKTLISVTGTKQEALATAIGYRQSFMSEMLNKKKEIKYSTLLLIAKFFGMSIVDLITYPKVFIPKAGDDMPAEAILQLRLSPDKRDQVMRLVFGSDVVDLIEDRINNETNK